ncbi:uncharacterized protein LOC130894229 [Diorhabda carinulata]|uniref:uncharacterized protein LOC130894229 n=1 Tax=Diorhabda carinulata TaxID=1163345 RepID=UPI00259FEA36|nr:uncharacterized protein LOC130894229 [Diorhabda carinulata]
MSEKIQDEEIAYTINAGANSENKRYLEGGPYGDGPSNTQQTHRDGVVIILKGNQDSAATSECSEDDLYGSSNYHFQKLKILRHKVESTHPFNFSFKKLESESKSNILDLEYNPPKKKSCIRVKTPKLESECHIPYHTQISIHENLFKNTVEQTESELKSIGDKQMVSKEVQCYENELETTKKLEDNTLNINLFPNVIINYDRSAQMRTLSSDTNSSKSNNNIILPNYVQDNSCDNCSPVTSTTIIENGKNSKYKPMFQYITYRKDPCRAKSTPIKVKNMIPFGPVVLQNSEKTQRVDSIFYLFDSTSASEDDKYDKEIFCEETERSEGRPVILKGDDSVCYRFCWYFKRFFGFFRKTIRKQKVILNEII